jgi:RHS repeat-associated protein
MFEQLEQRLMMNSDWRNPARPLDVNNDMYVSPLDALVVINALNSRGASSDLGVRQNRLASYLDTNGDRNLSPLDALVVINELNRSDRSSDNASQRIDGEAETAPAGFVSIVMGGLPGTRDQIVALSSQLSIGREEFNEMGLFVVDGPNGAVNGVLPSSPDYATEVFATANRQVLYSKRSVFRTAREATFPAGTTLGVYVLQETSDNGDGDKHLRVRETGTSKVRIGWEEHFSPSPWVGVGDRGYDDVMIDMTIGQPFDGNAEPVITAIPNQFTNEETELSIQTLAMDADLPNDSLRYSLDVAPTGATIDPLTGRFRWTPTEAQGPGNFEVIIRATDREGAFDTEVFTVTVLEVNRTPVLAPLSGVRAIAGDTVTFVANATDTDIPVNNLRFSLQGMIPVGASIDSRTGVFRWATTIAISPGVYPITVRVEDQGSPNLYDTKSTTITLSEPGCIFGIPGAASLSGQSGGTNALQGTVSFDSCIATLTEGNSFNVFVSQSFTIPSSPSAIQFTYQKLTFDTQDPSFINDAFEVALLDQDGNTLVAPFAAGKDAIFNATESMESRSATGILVNGNSVTIGLNGLPIGTPAKIAFRLVNNDSDRATSVQITSLSLVDSSLTASPANVKSTSALQVIEQSTPSTSSRAPANSTRGRTTISSVPNSPQITPQISVTSPDTQFFAGTPVVLSGIANAFTNQSNGSDRRIARVAVNGRPVDILDNAGNFFVRLDVQLGRNELLFTATDTLDQETSIELTVIGVAFDDTRIDFSQFSDISGSFSGQYFRSSFNDAARLLQVELATKNDGQFQTDVPLLVGVKNINDPSVTLLGFDGYTQDRIPYYDYSRFVDDGILSPDESTKAPTVFFHNPRRVQFDYELVFYGKLNSVPFFTSAPRVEVLAGRSYQYDVNADDVDDDSLSFALLTSPSGMSINEQSGEITWATSEERIGSHNVVVQVLDGRGGRAEQSFSLAVIEPAPNRPPVITSFPETHAIASDAIGGYRIGFASDDTRVTFTDVPSLDPNLVVDSQGKIHIAYAEGPRRPSSWMENIGYARVDFQGNIEVAAKTFGSNDFDIRPSIVRGKSDSIHVAWQASYSCEELFFASIDQQGVIQGTQRVTDTTSRCNSDTPVLKAKSDGSLFLVWSDEVNDPEDRDQNLRNDIFVQRIDPSRPSSVLDGPSIELTNREGTGFPNVGYAIPYLDGGVDQSDNLHVVWGDWRDATSPTEFRFYYEKIDRSGATIIDERVVSDVLSLSDVGTLRLVVDSQNYVHLFHRASTSSTQVLWHTVLGTDGSVLVKQPLFEGRVGSLDSFDVEVDSNDKIHVIRSEIEGRGSSLIYRRYSPSGMLLVNDLRISNSPAKAVLGDLAVTPDGKFAVTWSDERNLEAEIYVKTFSVEEVLSNTFRYDIIAFDADDDQLSFTLATAPSGMGIDPIRGVVEWAPGNRQVGNHTVKLQVSDGRGGNATQEFTICVHPDPLNNPPSIVSTPISSIPQLGNYRYVVEAVDSDDDSLEFELLAGPSGMSINRQSGVVSWTALVGGPSNVSIRVSDGRGGHATQVFRIDTTTELGEIRGRVWRDSNGNAVVDTDENVLRGWAVYLDVDQDGVLDAGETSVNTDENGAYVFTGLATGTFRVRTLQREEWEQTFPTDSSGSNIVGANVVNLLAGRQQFDANFGLRQTSPVARNGIPSLAPTEVIQAIVGRELLFQPVGTDPDADPLTFSVLSGPVGLAVHPQLGRVAWTPRESQMGSHQLVLRIDDGRGGVAVQNFSVDVSIPNTNPVITSLALERVVAGRPIVHSLSAQDSENQSFNFTLENAPAGMSIETTEVRGGNGLLLEKFQELVWDVPGDAAGDNFQFVLRVTDVSGGTDSQDWTLTVAEPSDQNTSPRFTSIPVTSTRRSQQWSYIPTASDTEYDNITFSLQLGPAGMSLDNGLLTWTPTVNSPSNIRVEVRANDARGGSAVQSFEIEVSSLEDNVAPVITSNPLLRTVAGATYHYALVAIDSDQDQLIWSLAASPRGMSIDALTGQILWTPDETQIGGHQIAVTVNDSMRGEFTQRFALEVVCSNLAPTIVSVPPTTALASQRYSYPLRAIDLEQDSLTWQLTTMPIGMTINTETGVIQWLPTVSQSGSHDVVVSVTDGINSVSQQFTIVVSISENNPRANRAPVITSTPVYASEVDTSYQYQVVAVDPDGQSLQFSLANPPSGMQISQTGLVSWTPSGSDVGNKKINVTVADALGAIATQGFTLSVKRNLPPVFISTPVDSVVAGAIYRYSLRAADPDGDPLTYELIAGPEGMTLDQNGRILWNSPLRPIAPQAVRVAVTDDRGQSAEQPYLITVMPDTTPPRVYLDVLSGGVSARIDNDIDLGSNYLVRVSASDNVGIADYGILVNGTQVALNASGEVQLPASTLGETSLTAFATDLSGLTIQEEIFIRIVTAGQDNTQGGTGQDTPSNPGPHPDNRHAPSIQISLPRSGAAVTGLTAIVGTIDDADDNLWYYRVYYASAESVSISQVDLRDVDWNRLREGTQPVENAEIAMLDASSLADGAYAVVVVAYDTNGLGMTSLIIVNVGDIASDPPDKDLPTNPGQNPNNLHAPLINIERPLPGSTVSDNASIIGSITDQDSNLWFYRVYYAQAGTVSLSDVDFSDTDWNNFHQGLEEVRNSEIALLNSSTLSDGAYAVAVAAYDTNGRGSVKLFVVYVGKRSNDPQAPDLPSNPGPAPGNAFAPDIAIISPESESSLTHQVSIVGTINDRDDNLWFYRTFYARIDQVTLSNIDLSDPQWVMFHQGTNEVTNGELAVFDASTLENDAYAIAVAAYDTNGLGTISTLVLYVEGNLLVGNFRLAFNDLTIPVAGIPITVTRIYDSVNANNEGDFGHGWSMGMQDARILEAAVTGEGSIFEEDARVFVPGKSKVYLTTPEGRRVGFTYEEEYVGGASRFYGCRYGCNYRPYFTPDVGVFDTLTIDETVVVRGDYADQLGSGINPNMYTLTSKSGYTYRYHETRGLESVTDINGNVMTFSDNRIAHSLGQQIEFIRDHRNRISEIVDPLGMRIRYEYSAAGDLMAVVDQSGNRTRFFYEEPSRPHFLTKILDPLGREGVRADYDEFGRLSQMIDAAGNTVEMIHDPNNFTQKIVDQLGNPTTYTYDMRGNVIEEIDPEGGVTQREYDGRDNVISETVLLADGTRLTTRFEYDDRGNVISETDPLGNRQTTTRNKFGDPLSVTDANGATTVFSYDQSGNLRSTTDADGSSTTITYDRSGNVTRLVVGTNTSTLAYDPSGRLIRQEDSTGAVRTFTFDANGNQLSESVVFSTSRGLSTVLTEHEYDAKGRRIKTTVNQDGVLLTRDESQFDAVGNLVTSIDALGRRTLYLYDERGQLVETVYPDTTQTTDDDNPRVRSVYDAAGRVIAETDEAGRRTRFEYDSNGRQIKTIFPAVTNADPNDLDPLDNPFIETVYDLAGRVVEEVDELGHRTQFVYDAVGNRILTILPDETPANDTDNPTLREVFDASRRRTQSIDPMGYVTKYRYSAAGLLDETILPDATPSDSDNPRTRSVFDVNRQLTSSIDSLGNVTLFEYDAIGRLTAVVQSVTDAASGQLKELRTEYAFDEMGNLTAQTDANDHTTRYEYDGLGRRTAVQLPAGQRSTTIYDVVGRIQTATDFNGNSLAFQYDSRDRLTVKEFPDGTFVSFDYAVTGEILRVTDTRGATEYRHDARGQLLSRTDPDNSQISYTYDASGNRTSVTTMVIANSPRTTTYTFTPQSQLATVTDSDGDVTRYLYDLGGRLMQTDYSNNTRETRSYNQRNQLLSVAHKNKVTDEVFASFDYELDFAGNRTALIEHDGRRVEYEYDELYRLLSENITAPGSAQPTRRMKYQYDDVGNRLMRDDTVEGATSYSYDANDRLRTQTLAGQVTTYRYDENGNTVAKAVNGVDSTRYEWDFENRLNAADTNADGVLDVAYKYDQNGIRVSQTLYPNGTTEITRFFIDPNLSYSQVLEEYTPGGIISVSYVHGLDLISQDRHLETGKSLYHVDGLGSTRALSNVNGLITNSYHYDAFGQVIHQSGLTENNFLFAGEYRNFETGLDYLRSRYLDFATGRFASRDSFEGFMQHPIMLHKYLYANANPIMGIDPSGYETVSNQEAAMAIQNTISQISTTSYRILGAIERAKSLVGILNTVSTIIGQFDAASVLPEFRSTVESFKSQGISLKKIRENFSLNQRRIVSSTQKWVADVILMGRPIRGIVLYMPSIGGIPFRSLRAGSAGIFELYIGFGAPDKKGSTILGGGLVFGVKGKDKPNPGEFRQLFRMDFGDLASTHPNKEEHDAWPSGRFHYHSNKIKSN